MSSQPTIPPIIPQNAFFALIHSQLGDRLEQVFRLGDGSSGPAASNNILGIQNLVGSEGLLDQLKDGTDGPPQITLTLVLDVAGNAAGALQSALDQVTGQSNPLSRIQAIQAAISQRISGVLAQQRNAIQDLIVDGSPVALLRAGPKLFEGIRTSLEAAHGGQAVLPLTVLNRMNLVFGMDAGAAMPVATVVQAVQRARSDARQVGDVLQKIENGLLAYFFSSKGYAAIDGTNVVAPVHLSDLKGAVAEAAQGVAAGKPLTLPPQLGGLFSKATAEHYLRDITRVIVESAYDAGRNLGTRCESVTKRLAGITPEKPKEGEPQKPDAKFASWLKGFGSLSESGAMRAVEVGTQGVSEFQTNPLIAAAAGSFAGTVARKLAQDSFLAVVDEALKQQAG